MTKTTKSFLPFILLFLVVMLTLGLGTVLAADSPELYIPSEIPASPDSQVDIPIQFTSNGNEISSMAFSLDYDHTMLTFDSSIPYSITFNLPAGIVGSCTVDEADTDGEIDCIVVDPMAPLAPVPDGIFLTIKLATLNVPDNSIAYVNFAAEPPPSFGNTEGNSVDGTTVDGSVKIGSTSSKVYMPAIIKHIPPTPTPTPEFTHTPTSTLPPGETPTKTPTPTPTSTPIEPTCTDYVVNGDFEDTSDEENDDDGWEIPVTSYSASFSTAKAHSSERSLLTGIKDSAQNTYSWSSGYQVVSLPGNATKAQLTFWNFPRSGETLVQRLAASLWMRLAGVSTSEPHAFDIQYVAVEDLSLGTDAEIVFWQVSDSREWEEVSINLKDYAGHVIKIWFTTYNDGNDGVTAMYVDDVALEVCR
jgi:hypothetical protein